VALSGLTNFWSELRRRKVVRAIVVYIIVAWVVLEAASVIFPALLLPDWSERLVLALVLIGFPLAVVLAWAFELSPDGLQREKPKSPEPVAAEPGQATNAAVAPGVRSDSRHAIAVLPLTNMSGDPENEFFSDGIAEEILILLARQPDLRVVSRTSSFSFKNTNLDIPTIAKQLGVDGVLEGSVRRVGNRVRIAAQLIDATTDAHLWSESYDREIEDIFALQIEIARSIVDAMQLTPGECLTCGGVTENIHAYEHYLRGRNYFHQITHASLEFARQMFSKAIELDPNFARAYAGLADTESIVAQWIDRSPERLAAADHASRKALELAPELAEAHSSRGFALTVNGDYVGAAEHFERALVLDPQHYETLYLYGRARLAQGEPAQAAELWARAHDAQPDEFQSAALRSMVLNGAGDGPEAREANRLAVELIERRLDLNPDDLRALQLGPGLLIDAGRRAEGLAMADRSVALAPTDSGVLHNAAAAYAHAGEADQALALLERRLQRTGMIYRDWMENDPDWDNVRDDPRFIAFLEKMPSSRSGRT
jgi:adenylate cyclase